MMVEVSERGYKIVVNPPVYNVFCCVKLASACSLGFQLVCR